MAGPAPGVALGAGRGGAIRAAHRRRAPVLPRVPACGGGAAGHLITILFLLIKSV